MKPRLLIVGRSRYRLPLERGPAEKFAALRGELDLRVLASARDGSPTTDETFRLVPPSRPLDGLRFWAALPARVRREVVDFRPDAILVQSPYEAAAVLLAHVGRPVILEVHGDWRTATRLYGSSARRLLAPLADRIADASVRRVDAVRTISTYTTGLVRSVGVEPSATFPAFMDLEPFLSPPLPLPPEPHALFVGVLERYKGVDTLADAWRLAAPRTGSAKLRVIGRGTRAHVIEALVRDLPDRTEWEPELPNALIAGEIDAATVLVLPSRSEGLGRIVVETLCRGRPVVATHVGGITDLVSDGVNGILVGPHDSSALADAVVRVVGDRSLAERLASGARPSVGPWLATPEEYAARVRSLVEKVRR
jgi:glycosyltransferase involved in cell wall biosynthesis